MNREQFEEKKGEEDLDAIQASYFDCNALDRLGDQEAAGQEQANDPSEELKMDKNLGLFEMINAGDFATVSANPEPASNNAAGQNDAQSFNFDAYNGNQNQAAPG